MNSFAITQQKGGVGKTTNTINIAGALAARGHHVLTIDADPQGYLTNTLGFRDAYQSDPPSLYNAINSPHDHDPTTLIVEHPEFDVLPANIDMFRLEQDLIASGRRPRQRMEDVLDQLDDYDYVLIDAPPSLGPINDNVLLAAQDILIPVEAADSSVLAIEHLLNQIESLERDYGVQITEQALLISNVNYPLDNEQADAIEWFRDTFDGRAPVFEVRNRAAVKRSLASEGSIFGEEAEDTDMTTVYDDIAAALEEVSD
ncbi:ParA family protein [Halobacterium sp. BOL4-2]|uniref:ParA family protein n=1 Tax=Halobacterium sp. BOL4-2 TaxID=2810537 RepID=UPI001962AD52|nr:ParA family protein [Halobacterium sp. BOL4-2]QRY26395.1 ParA family protein [Halobacterium sp. BOL4-2]